MNKGIREALVKEFQDWQRLGQGGLPWDRPVLPEPYFHPFFSHGVFLEQPEPKDDGHRETWLSRIAGDVSRAFLPPEPKPEPVTEEWDFLKPLRTGEAPDYLVDDRNELFHGAWLLPRDIVWNPKEWETLLYSLSVAQKPVCLEILGTGGSIHFGWVVDESDHDVLVDVTAATGTGIEPRTDLLQEWLESSVGGFLWNRELRLAREFFFPIRHEFHSDPYQGILAALSRISADSLGVVQILFEPCANSWTESLWRSVTLDSGQPFFAGGQAYLQAVRQKCSQPLFAASARIALFSADPTDPNLAERLSRSLSCFDGTNHFTLEPSGDEAGDDLFGLVTRSFNRSGMILNAAELFALIHPPSHEVGSPALQRMAARTHKVPAPHAAGRGLYLGTNQHAGKSTDCWLSESGRSRHMHVIGASGTGKSTFLLHSMIQDMEAGHGFALLDPHGDLAEAVLDHLPEHRIKDVVWFNPADTEFPVGFNILRAHSEIEKNLLASDFVAIFERLSSSWGDQMTAVLGNAALALLESDRGGTLCDLKRFLIERNFRDQFLEGVRDPEVVYFWKREFPLLRGTTQGSLLTRLSGFLRHRLIRNMVSQQGERFDVARLMDEGKIILAPLSQGLIGQENSWLLGSLLVSRFYQAALSRQSREEEERRPFILYLDEAHHFITPSIASILSGTRKYGLSLVLAHQELDQFPSRESGILGSILTNCHTRVCFRLGDQDAVKFESGFANFEAGDLGRLELGEAVCRIGGVDQDFNLRVSPPPSKQAGSLNRRNAAIEHSRSTYATPREQVEQHTLRLDAGEIPERKTNPKSARSQLPARRVLGAQADCVKSTDPPLEEFADSNQHSPSAIPAIPVPESISPKAPGRGGSRHKHLQRVIKAHGNGLGFRATIEAELPGRSGCVDVLLESGEETIAFEVADRSPIEQEMKNIRKCVEAGVSALYVVSEESIHLSRIQEMAETEIPDLSTVHFIPAADLGEVFSELGARLASSESTSRGYRVKTTYKSVGLDQREIKTREIHRAVAKSFPTVSSQPDVNLGSHE